MGDFNLLDFVQTVDWDGAYEVIEPEWSLWCLGHNFDVVGAILAMSELSWQKGFEAGKVTAHFDDESLATLSADDAAAVYSIALHQRKNSANRGGGN